MNKFLSYYPLKQGLKRISHRMSSHTSSGFLLYYPLKQGLKRFIPVYLATKKHVFTLLSIKTRIETN